MDLINWAKEEVNRAKETNNNEYLSLCLDSALKALESLYEDGHSGMSISMTSLLLNRLIDSKPLSDITEKDFKDINESDEAYLNDIGALSMEQCKRYSALFKTIYKDGTVKYSDVNRTVFYDGFDKNYFPCMCSKVSRFIDELYPISLPYFPEKPFQVYGHFSDDTNNRVYIDYYVTPELEKISVGQYV